MPDSLPSVDSGRPKAVTVFISDASVEAERIAQALRGRGYAVFEVPLTVLVARVHLQRPNVVIVDADSDGALEAVARIREVPDGDGIDVLFVGQLGVVFASAEDALAQEGSGFFPRPVNAQALVRKIAALLGSDVPPAESRSLTPPPSIPSSIPSPLNSEALASSNRAIRPRMSSLPPASLPTNIAPRFAPGPDPAFAPDSLHRGAAARPPLSLEVERLLADAEDRVSAQLVPDAAMPSPEEEIESLLPADLLASLDESMDEEDDVEEPEPPPRPRDPVTSSGAHKGSTGSRSRTGATEPPVRGGSTPSTSTQGTYGGGKAPNTATGRRAQRTSSVPMVPAARPATTPSPEPEEAPQAPSPVLTVRPSRRTAPASQPELFAATPHSGPAQPASEVPPTHSGAAAMTPVPTHRTPEPSAPSASAAAGASSQRHSEPPKTTGSPGVATLSAGSAAQSLASAIASRVTGVVAFVEGDTARHVVLREGDVVTAASLLAEESLLAFLAWRGDLPVAAATRLSGRTPPFGRHAGAALVAHGHIHQDQLWVVLRAHAEWVLGLIVQLRGAVCRIDEDPPARLKSEPAVFGAATGAAVFVEALRRVVAPTDALARLGGPESRVGRGPQEPLLDECGLDRTTAERLRRSYGQTVAEATDVSSDGDGAPLLLALSLLEIVEIIRAIPGAAAKSAASEEADTLDADAIRARVRARRELVDEGDYFAVLGVPREATSYEIRRAFLELRRAFEPSRVLTPQVIDLADDLRKITEVLEEAYEILRDPVRRERYRRAIEGPVGL